jgi:hypothetical protein
VVRASRGQGVLPWWARASSSIPAACR